MKQNMSNIDRFIRLVVVVVLGILYQQQIVTGAVGIVLLVVAVVFLATSFIGFCPLYTIFGLRTKKN
jgi:hypothetical protein